MLRIASLLALITIACALSGCANSSSNGPTPVISSHPAPNPSDTTNQSAPAGGTAAFTRPVLANQKGQYFTWDMPADWKPAETANGVDMTSPDGKLIVNSEL